jgi:hypothetical protein
MSEKANSPQSASIQLRAIEIVNQNILKPTTIDLNSVNWSYGLGVEMKLDPTNKLVYVFINVVIQPESKETTLGSITTSCIFQIDNWSEIVTTTETGQFKLPEPIIIMLNSISISTTRGIMFSQFKGTFLHNAVLPIIDPKQFKFEEIKP